MFWTRPLRVVKDIRVVVCGLMHRCGVRVPEQTLSPALDGSPSEKLMMFCGRLVATEDTLHVDKICTAVQPRRGLVYNGKELQGLLAFSNPEPYPNASAWFHPILSHPFPSSAQIQFVVPTYKYSQWLENCELANSRFTSHPGLPLRIDCIYRRSSRPHIISI